MNEKHSIDTGSLNPSQFVNNVIVFRNSLLEFYFPAQFLECTLIQH